MNALLTKEKTCGDHQSKSREAKDRQQKTKTSVNKPKEKKRNKLLEKTKKGIGNQKQQLQQPRQVGH